VALPVATPVRHVDPPSGSSAGRRVYLDNLKAVLVTAVIVGHAFITYGDVGSWKYHEPSTSDLFNIVAGLVVAAGSLFVMGLFFLVAGMLTPRSLRRKGPARFSFDRVLRLGLPLGAYVVFVFPFLDWVGDGFEGSLLATLGDRIPDWDPGPLWFVAALLLFSLGYAAYRAIRPARDLPVALPARHLVWLAAGIAIATFLVRLQFPIDSSQFLMIHLWQWPQCIGLFTLGIVAAERGWLDPVPERIRTLAGRWAVGGMVVMVCAMAASRDSLDPWGGGWTWQAGVVSCGEGIVAVSLAVWLLARFRSHHDVAGPLRHAAGRAAFGAYVLQAPVLVGLSVALQDVGIPPEGKFLVVAPLGVILSFAAARLLTLVPGLRRLL
jgi:hypothetical protein